MPQIRGSLIRDHDDRPQSTGFAVVLLLSGCVRMTVPQGAVARSAEAAETDRSRPGAQDESKMETSRHGDEDDDEDGFPDASDACPKERGVEPDGCPIPDVDGDGILDPYDKCLTERETSNLYFDEDGCPDVPPQDLAEFIGVVRAIQFERDGDILTRAGERVLERAAQVFKRYPMVRVEVTSHLNTSAPVEYGRDLSARRAHAVKQFLVRQGVSSERIMARGAGNDEPIDTNETASGRAENERVEFVIIAPGY